MKKLICDVCGGKIIVQSREKVGVCESCGVSYSAERMYEIANGLKSNHMENEENLKQLKALAEKYFDLGLFTEAEDIVIEILEIVPNDSFAKKLYEDLQALKYFDIQNVTLVCCNGKISKINIPDTVDRIKAEVFKFNKDLQEVIFSKNCRVSVIEKDSFQMCKNLKTVRLPDGLKIIEDSAFYGCTSLTNIQFPSTLQTIGMLAFFHCNSLTNINLPENLRKIGWQAFAYCNSLEAIKLNSKLKVDESAFMNCISLTNIKFTNIKSQNKFKYLDINAFSGCEKLKAIEFSDGLLDIERFYEYDGPLSIGWSQFEEHETSILEFPENAPNHNYMDKGKNQQQTQSKTDQCFCPNCGNTVSLSDGKCKKCGKQFGPTLIK